MTDLPAYGELHPDDDLDTQEQTASGTSRWVWVAIVAAIVAFLLIVFLHLTGSGPKGLHSGLN